MSLANYPASMRMLINRLSNFARSRVKTQVYSPSGTARANDVIKFEIPSGCIVDTNTISIHGKISTDYTTSTGVDYVLPPKFSASLIQELKVSFNGTLVFQCNDINQLYNSYMRYMGGDAERNRESLFEFGRNWIVAPGADTKLDSIPFFIAGLMGSPLSCGKLINTSLTGPILIEWRVIPTQALVAAGGPGYTISLTDLSIQYDVVVTDGFYEELQLRALETNGALELAFKNYMVSIGSSQTLNNANHRVSISTKSLDAIWVSMLPNDYFSGGNAFKTEIESSNYFMHGVAEAGPVSVQIGNTMYPQYDLQDSSQIAAMTFAGMGILNDTLGSTAEAFKGPVGSTGTVARSTFIDKFNKGNYLAYFRLNACPNNEIYGVTTLSGINTQGASPFINVTYKQDATITGTPSIIPWIALEYTSIVRIGKFRQIELDP